MENQERELLNKIDRIATYLIILFIVLFVFLIINWFDLNLIPNESSIKDEEKIRSAYGALGDYFGGILNPIFGFFGVIILLWTLRITRKEMIATKKALQNQETELLLTRLSEIFINQCERVVDNITTLSVSFPSDSPVFSNRKVTGLDVIYDLAMILQDASDSNQYRNAIRNHVLIPNSRKIGNYSKYLSSSLNLFVKTINLNNAELGEKEKEQLFSIVDAVLNIENNYYFMHVLHEANRASELTGMKFPYSRELSEAKALMKELNRICRPNDIINSDASLEPTFEVQMWGQPHMRMGDL